MNDDEDIEEMLRNIPPVEYPRDKLAATRAEFKTMVRKYPTKKPGCPLFASLMLLSIVGLGLTAYWVLTTTIMAFANGMMWMLSF